MKPTELGQRDERGEHYLIAEEGKLPCNALVWRCEDCGARAVEDGEFDEIDCESEEAVADA